MGSRTPEQAREYNAKRREEYRRKKETGAFVSANAPIIASNSENANVSETALSVDVVVTDPPKKSLKERLFGGSGYSSAQNTQTRTRSRGKKQENLLVTLLPTVLASLAATFIRDLIPDPYKLCAPSQSEAGAMITPLLNMLARRIEITGKASQDAIDITNAIVSGIVFGTRSYVTYVQIKEAERQGGGEYTSGVEREIRNTTDQNRGIDRSGGAGFEQSGSNSGGTSDQNGHPADGSDEKALFDQMFARDKQGRIRLGLLPN